jgi:hypothetical protein
MSDRISSEPQSIGDAASLTDPRHTTDTGPEPEPALGKSQTGVHPVSSRSSWAPLPGS